MDTFILSLFFAVTWFLVGAICFYIAAYIVSIDLRKSYSEGIKNTRKTTFFLGYISLLLIIFYLIVVGFDVITKYITNKKPKK
jgi:hypothetical protein